MHDDQLLTVAMAAKERKVHPKAIYRIIKEGRMPVVREGKGAILIRYGDLMKWRGTPGRTKREEPNG